MNFERRLIGLQKKMLKEGIDLVVYGSCQNFQYLTGLPLNWRRWEDLGCSTVNVFVPRKGEPVLTLDEDSAEQAQHTWIKDCRILAKKENYRDMLRKVISEFDLKRGNIGLGNHVWGSTVTQIATLLKNPRFLRADGLMDDLRMIKDDEEIERLRKSAMLTDKVMEKVVPNIEKGVTQKELELEVELEGRRLGASDVSFPPTAGFVKSDSEVSRNPFAYPLEKGLVAGTSVAFDIGFVVDGYCSDFGRSFHFGSASTEVKKGYEALQQSVIETVEKMRDGCIRVCDVFPALEKVLDKLGYGDYLRARLSTKNLGHNIGVEVHEPPWLSPEYEDVLRENMVMALEPKLWHAGEYYLRVEDMVLIGPKKTEFLTKFDRSLFQL